QLNTTATSLTTLNEYGQYRVNSPNITVTGDLPEANLRVYLTDATTGESLGQATVTNTSFSADIQLSGVGSRTVELRLVDEAGNDSTGTIDIFADVTQPVILDFLNVPDTATLDPVSYLDVQFSEIIDLNTFDKTDISLLRDGQAVTLPDTVTISQVSGSTYRINGLDTLTTTPGTYSLEVNATTLQDNAGNSGIAAETAIFTIAEPPTPGVTLTATGGNTTVTEGGNTDTYSIILDTQPTADVTVTLTVGAGITTDTNILTFNDSNWNQPQTITVTAVNDTTPEGDHTATITHTTNSSDSNYNNLTLPNINVSISDNDAEIQGMKWHDLDGDGVKDTDEPGLQGWTIYLDSNTNGQLDAGEISVVTDENGNYTFTNLRPDTYTVAEVMQEGWQQTYPQVNVTTTGAEIELYIPNSPIISNETYTTTSATNLINLDDFWADARFTDIKGTGFTSVIIDTGIDLNHPLFGADDDNNGIADKILYQYDFADQDNNASDKNNHGSHIASIFSSIAPDANLIVLKVFSDEGSGFFSDLEAALQWVTTNADAYNVASVNLSLGDNQNWITQTARYGIGDELAALASQNILIAAAAGNSFYQYASTPGLAYPAIDPNVISVGAVWADNFGSRTFTGGAGDYTTDTDRIASFSQRHPELLDTFAPGILITGANATGGTISMGGTSQATPYVTALATLAQEIAQEYLGRKLSVTEFRTLLETTGDLIIDGDDENDNVSNTGASYPRINAIALAEAILNLDGSDSTSTPDHPDNNSTNDPIYIPENTFSLVHTVNLTAGQVATDIDFGNQLIPPILSITPTDAEKEEGDSGTTAYSFTLTRAENTTGETSVTYEVTGSGNNPANADDFGGTFPSDTVTFADGETEKEITVEVTGDSQVEPDENFTLNLTNPSGGAQITNGTATGTILNDDTENTPPQAFYFSTDANTYSPGETLSLTNAWVLDPDGTSDIERVDMWLLAPEGDWRNVEDAEDFEPWSGGNQWASFDEYTLDLSGLESGEYTLWGKAYDSAGNASDAYTTTFEVSSVSQSTQTQSNTQTLSQVQQESSSTSSGDELTGMAANDSLVTQQDGDKLTKSDSNDPFVYTSLSESGDVITDFQVADDQIVLTEVLESVDYQGSDALADGYVRLVQGSSATQVQIDPDGLQ
ncbi:MAG: S8 family serine peptidase, partial [Coleofasciculus sp. C2-GNP5-27]